MDLQFILFVAVREEVSNLETRLVFGASLDLDLLGIEIEDTTLIPGLAVATSRAKPLAGMIDLPIFFNFIVLTFIFLCEFVSMHEHRCCS